MYLLSKATLDSVRGPTAVVDAVENRIKLELTTINQGVIMPIAWEDLTYINIVS